MQEVWYIGGGASVLDNEENTEKLCGDAIDFHYKGGTRVQDYSFNAGWVYYC